MPELSVLLAWTKIILADELIESDLPDDPYCQVDLVGYFPTQLKEGFQTSIASHPLRREIIVTQVVNDLVNGAGMTYWPRLAGETGATPEELTRANFVAREIFGSLPLREELQTYDNKLDAGCQTRMRIEMRTLVERASRWLVNNRRPPLDSQGTVDYFSERVQLLMAELPSLLTGRSCAPTSGGCRGSSSRECPRSWPPAWRCSTRRTSCSGVVRDRRPDDARPGRGHPPPLRARRTARACPTW